LLFSLAQPDFTVESDALVPIRLRHSNFDAGRRTFADTVNNFCYRCAFLHISFPWS